MGKEDAWHRIKYLSSVEMAGKRMTKRKLSPGLKAWNEKVMKHFKKGRSTRGKKYTLKMAMKDAKKEK